MSCAEKERVLAIEARLKAKSETAKAFLQPPQID